LGWPIGGSGAEDDIYKHFRIRIKQCYRWRRWCCGGFSWNPGHNGSNSVFGTLTAIVGYAPTKMKAMAKMVGR